MKEKNKRAIGLAGVWAVVATLVFTPIASGSRGITIDGFLFGLCVFTPIQFIVGLVFSRLLTWSNQGGIMLRLARFLEGQELKRLPKKMTICQDCGADGSKEIAQWACFYDKWWRKEYPREKPVSYFCTSCMVGNLEGMHTGGGPTAAAYKKIIRIQPYFIGQDIDKGAKP
jgi:hypothetical protein